MMVSSGVTQAVLSELKPVESPFPMVVPLVTYGVGSAAGRAAGFSQVSAPPGVGVGVGVTAPMTETLRARVGVGECGGCAIVAALRFGNEKR